MDFLFAFIYTKKNFTHHLGFIMSDNTLKKGSHTTFSNKIGLAKRSNKEFLTYNDDVMLSFPFKDTVLEAGMNKEDTKRDERFLHLDMDGRDIDVLFEPKVLTNFQYFDNSATSQHVPEFFDENDELTQNLLIKGNNLLALHSLKSRLSGKIKLIYIDPPYNTGNDGFKYNDNFNHSSWLVFMKNRLEIARELLSDDGVIFVQCDYNEDAYLRVLMDEIFDRDSFVANIAVKSSTPSGTKTAHKDKKIIKQKDTLLMYKKGDITINPQYIARDNWDTHYSIFLSYENGAYKLEKVLDVLNRNGFDYKKLEDINPTNEKVRDFIERYAENIVTFQSHKKEDVENISRNQYPNQIYENIVNGEIENLYYNGRMVSSVSRGLKEVLVGKHIKKYWSMLLCDFWSDIDFQNTQNEGGVSLTSGKKPEALMRRIIDMVTNPNDIVLDYHLGSGTTCAVAHKMGRRWIGIEQMDYIEDITKVRLQKVLDGEQGGISKAVEWTGGGSFCYFELKKYNQYFIDKINSANTMGELDNVYNEMSKNAFFKFWYDKKEFEKSYKKDKDDNQISLEERKKMLIDILDENQLYHNVADMDDNRYNISDDDKALTKAFYGE